MALAVYTGTLGEQRQLVADMAFWEPQAPVTAHHEGLLEEYKARVL